MSAYSVSRVDYFCRKLWYEEVLCRTQLSNPKQLERLFKPHLTVSEQYNNWYFYQKGQRTPSPQTQRVVEAHLSGSSIILKHILWDILRLEAPFDEALFQQLYDRMAPLQQAILRSKKHPFTCRKSIAKILVKEDDLDSLAALVLFWKYAYLKESTKNARLAARFVYYFLLMSDFRFLHDEANGTLLFDALSELVLNHSMRDSERAKNTHEIWYKNRALLRANADSVTYSCFISEVFDRRNALYRTLKKPSQLDGDFQDIS